MHCIVRHKCIFTMINLVKPQDTHCVSKANQRIFFDYINETVTAIRGQSSMSNHCQIRTSCITGRAEKSNPPLAS